MRGAGTDRFLGEALLGGDPSAHADRREQAHPGVESKKRLDSLTHGREAGLPVKMRVCDSPRKKRSALAIGITSVRTEDRYQKNKRRTSKRSGERKRPSVSGIRTSMSPEPINSIEGIERK